MTRSLCLIDGSFAVVQLDPDTSIPDWALIGKTWAVVRTEDELSIVCGEDQIPTDVRSELGWRIIKVLGPLDFSLVGVLADLARVLAEAEISIFAISTFDTDYLLVKEHKVKTALEACRKAGYQVA